MLLQYTVIIVYSFLSTGQEYVMHAFLLYANGDYNHDKVWLFGVNEKLLTRYISGLVTKYKLLYIRNQGRQGLGLGLGLGLGIRVRARGQS